MPFEFELRFVNCGDMRSACCNCRQCYAFWKIRPFEILGFKNDLPRPAQPGQVSCSTLSWDPARS